MNIVILIILLIVIFGFLKLRNRSIFLRATQSAWYRDFLNPIAEKIIAYNSTLEVLDIGTGSGTLPQMLIAQNNKLKIIGIDINNNMIDCARKRVKSPNITFINQENSDSLDFNASRFDVITICSVLFLLENNTKTILLNEALRVLNPRGKIMILTPKGEKSIFTAFIEVWNYKFSLNNFTFPIWRFATTLKGRQWQNQKFAETFATQNNMLYEISTVFNNNATIEVLTKP